MQNENVPRHPILRQLLKPVHDNRPHLRRFRALSVREAAADAECLFIDSRIKPQDQCAEIDIVKVRECGERQREAERKVRGMGGRVEVRTRTYLPRRHFTLQSPSCAFMSSLPWYISRHLRFRIKERLRKHRTNRKVSDIIHQDNITQHPCSSDPHDARQQQTAIRKRRMKCTHLDL